MKKKIIVFEPNINSAAHSEINAGMLEILENIHSNEELHFWGSIHHIEALKQKKSFPNWTFTDIKINDYKPSCLFINEIILTYRIINILWYQKNVSRIYLLGILPISHIILSYLNKKVKKDIIITLHGQMEALLDNTKIGLTKYYYRISKNIFIQNDNLRYIIFGESIFRNLQFLFGNNIVKTIIVDQPYLYQKQSIHNNSNSFPQVVLGLVGRADKGKRVDELFVLMDNIIDDLEKGRVQIKIIGKLFVDIPYHLKKYLSYYSHHISNEVFEKDIMSIDFVLSFTNKEYYKATPSGVLFDCIKYRKPVLGLENDYIMYYFQKFGSFGKLFENVQQMTEYIKNREYENIDFNALSSTFEFLQEQLSTKALTEKIKEQL